MPLLHQTQLQRNPATLAAITDDRSETT